MLLMKVKGMSTQNTRLTQEHNEEAQQVWDAFNTGLPIRPPVHLGTMMQYFLFNDDLNPGERVSFEAYSTDAETMLTFQLRSQVWRGEKIAPYCDDQIGVPEAFEVKVDLQNFDEAAYFGAPIVFMPHQVPDTEPIYEGDRKWAFLDYGLPDPLRGGWYEKAHQLFEQMCALLEATPSYLDRPIRMGPFGIWTGGILTLAIALRGQALLMDIYEDPDYVRAFFSYLVEGTIQRIRAHLAFFGLAVPAEEMFFADDAIQMISTGMLKEFLIPEYKRLKVALTSADQVKVHLCGDATRHFKILKENLGVNEFETGFPVDFGWLRRELGPDVLIHGGPSVVLLRDGTPDEVQAETHRILHSGICDGGRFVLREGNNLAPGTPFENLAAMYEEARRYRCPE